MILAITHSRKWQLEPVLVTASGKAGQIMRIRASRASMILHDLS